MFCGTLAVRGEIGGGERFEIELHDPVKNRSLRMSMQSARLEIGGLKARENHEILNGDLMGNPERA